MFKRIAFGVGVALLATLLFAPAANAKTALTSSSVPDNPVAGEPFQVGFTLENHEGMGLDDETFKVTATSVGTGETHEFEALFSDGAWTATVTLPEGGTWVLRVVNEDLGFQQDLGATSVALSPTAPVTNAQLTAALEQARSAITADVNAQYAGRIAALESELTSMQTSVDDLATQRDALLAQNDSLRASLNSQSDFSPWLAAAAGAAVAAATLAGGYLLARRRGIIRSDRAAVAVRA